MRLALDWGRARIGVAACDAHGVLAFPVTTVQARRGAVDDIVALVAQYEPIEIVLGLPTALSGRQELAAQTVRERGLELVDALTDAGRDVPVRLVDERMSTVQASRRLHEGGRSTRQQRAVIDQAAAVAILEHALQLEDATGRPPGQVLSAAISPQDPATQHSEPDPDREART